VTAETLLEAKLNMFELVIGEVDMILGNLEDEREFPDVVAGLWAESTDQDEFARRVEDLRDRLVEAKRAYFPTGKLASASVDSIRVFQNRRTSGRPSRSRGPGTSSRKNLASCWSNERKPLGTTLAGRGSESSRAEEDSAGSVSRVDPDSEPTVLRAVASDPDAASPSRNWRRSSARSRAVL
jgi:hypothetical protein